MVIPIHAYRLSLSTQVKRVLQLNNQRVTEKKD